jgi:hypothetical protein
VGSASAIAARRCCAKVVGHSPEQTKVFWSEVESGSRQENAPKQESGVDQRFHEKLKDFNVCSGGKLPEKKNQTSRFSTFIALS